MKLPERSVRWLLSTVLAVATIPALSSPAVSQDDSGGGGESSGTSGSGDSGGSSESGDSSDSSETTKRQKFEDTIHVIQRKPVLEGLRLEIVPRFGMSVNDSIYRSFKAGGNLNFHVSERVYIGGLFEWFDFGGALGGQTKAFRKTFDQTDTAPDAPIVQWFGALEVGYKPIYGKFALFNSAILYYNVGITLGGGVLNAGSITTPISTTSPSFGGTVSLSSRLFLNDFMAMDLELRDLIFQATLQDGRQNALGNLVTVAAGVSFYIPPSFKYSTPKKDEGSE